MAIDARDNGSDQPAGLSHLDNRNQRAILIQGDEGSA
jgi:hypothetical protein